MTRGEATDRDGNGAEERPVRAVAEMHDGSRVLIADDVATYRALLRSALEKLGDFTVVGEAENGAEALELAKAAAPDFVMLDLSMPELDGLEALPLLLASLPATKVIVLSGYDAQDMADRALALGASLYLEKGATPQEIVEAITGLISEPQGEADPSST